MTRKLFKHNLDLIFGILILISTLIFIILGGSHFFYNLSISSTRVGLHNVFGNAFYLMYYTIQTNLFLGFALVILHFYKRSIVVNSIFFASIILITLTFLIYWTAVAPFNSKEAWENIYLNFDSIITHVINPFLGFIYLFIFRKKIIINKKIVGFLSLYIGFFIIINHILYAATSYIDENGNISGKYVYKFLDVKNILFINLENHPAISITINILLILVAPFIGIGFSWCWIKALKLRSLSNSYFSWIDKIKDNNKIKK